MIAEAHPSSGPGPDEITVRPEEDFLFHLYRGSELLDDHRLLEAKSELEYALTLQPADARTLGLLAVVYFRSGFVARAIACYRELLEARPVDPTLRLNLALCFLKSGQSEAARVELESLITEDVSDTRAWGYLAIALERLGYLDQAREAFERAGETDLAWRMVERGAARPRAQRQTEARPPRTTFDPVDAGELRLDLVKESPSAVRPNPLTDAAPPPRHDTLGWGTQLRGSASDAARASRAWIAPMPLANFIEDARLERLGDPPGITLMGTQLARVELDATTSPQGFAFRLDALRSYHGAVDPEIVPRQSRAQIAAPLEAAGETFGGIGTPFVSMKPPGQILLGPRSSQRVHAFVIDDEVVFFRESVLLGFDLTLQYENGRMGMGGTGAGGDAVPVVQLKGQGTLLLEIAADLLALDVKGDAKSGGLTVRREAVVGWAGRLLPRPLPSGEAPGGQRGLLCFSGEGTVLVSVK